MWPFSLLSRAPPSRKRARSPSPSSPSRGPCAEERRPPDGDGACARRAPSTRRIGVVTDVHVKMVRGQPMQRPAAGLRLQARSGVVGTAGSSAVAKSEDGWALSPRQVLIASASDLRHFELRPGGLRENLAVELDGAPALLSEVFVSGAEVHIVDSVQGSRDDPAEDRPSAATVRLRLTFPCDACGHVIDAMRREDKSRNAFPTIKELEPRRGWLATVVSGGSVRAGDEVRMAVPVGQVQVPVYESFADLPQPRFLATLQKIPAGRVLTISKLLAFAGAAPGFARAMPAILRRPEFQSCPATRRLVYATGELFKPEVFEDQRAVLEAEGTQVEGPRGGAAAKASGLFVRDFGARLWKPSHEELFLTAAVVQISNQGVAM